MLHGYSVFTSNVDGQFQKAGFADHDLDCGEGGAQVFAQPGGFYGGWVTPELTGPFKGETGSSGW